MSGSFSVSGLVTGLNSSSIISALLALDRQPITRAQNEITQLQSQQTAINDLRTALFSLRNTIQDFRLSDQFAQYAAKSSSESTLSASISGPTPVVGAYTINVTQLASATVAKSGGRLGSAINPAAALDSSGISQPVTAGTFSINGVQFTVNPATDTLNSVLSSINSSAAGVTATYDSVNDRVVLTNTTVGDTSIINFGATGDTSNFLTSISVTGATQGSAGNGSTQVTSTLNLGAVDPSKVLNQVSFGGGAVTGGSFRVNGISISVDPTTDSLSDVIQRINDSDAGVAASYDASTDTIQVVSSTPGSRTVSFTSGTSNFLDVTKLTTATQTAGNDAQFSINGGPTLTRNTNEIADAVGGVTLNLLSTGSSTVTISADNDAVVKKVNDFITQFNSAVTQIRGLVAKDGALEGDSSIRMIDSYLQGTVFNTVAGLSGTFQSLADIGVSTGDTFNADTIPQLELNSDKFLEALRTNRGNVSSLFSNSNGTGIADQLFTYLDATSNTTGFLYQRASSNGTIDQQITGLNDQISNMENQLALKQKRLQQQFAQMEQLAATYQAQGSSLSGMSSILGSVSSGSNSILSAYTG